ncbi:hypothetical protein VTN49DRAFT_735 [Thermomyces lanuginosus]|uniref:uncharacterized protein n=1 Tax=Thermomyces lanuginosus TaxID=5541 RepID=UPI0037446A56
MAPALGGQVLTDRDGAMQNRVMSNNIFVSFDTTSSTTDTLQQPWLPQLSPPQPLAQPSNPIASDKHNQLEDFVLYPPSRPQVKLRDERASALKTTTPKQFANFPHPVSGHRLDLASRDLQHRESHVIVMDTFNLTSTHFADDMDSPAMFAGQNMPGTVSPKDILVDGSAPPSTSFTDISTPPSFGNSPGTFSQNTSPMFQADFELAPEHETWESLFPTDAISVPLDDVDAHFNFAPKPVPKPVPQAPVVKSASSPELSPGAKPGRRATLPSTTNGVKKTRRHHKEVVYNMDDPADKKRYNNTMAARRSRAAKQERFEAMQRRIEELEAQLEQSNMLVEQYKSQVETLEATLRAQQV